MGHEQSRRALLLSGSVGLGHEMMARACTEVLRPHGWQTETCDVMTMLGGLGSRIGAAATRRLMTTRGAHDALHFGHLRTGSPTALAMARASNAQVVPALRQRTRSGPPDLLLSVFATGAAAAAALKPEAPERPTVVFCTDACVHRLWVWPGTDLFLVTSPAAEQSVRRFQPEAEVRVVPPPVRERFFTAPERQDARRRLGLPADEPCVLLMDSGWGFGPGSGVADRLTAAGVRVIAVAGRNRRLAREWSAAAAANPRVLAYGETEEVPLLMAAADLVVCLPGATTCGEARALGRPLMLLDLMPGHGRDNLQQQLDLGDAFVCDATPEGMSSGILAAVRRGLPSRPRRSAREWPAALTGALRDIGVTVDQPKEEIPS